MLNKNPIILNCFARGGSNLLVNLLASHPGVCISRGETNKVFKGQTRLDTKWTVLKKSLLYHYPLLLLSGQNIFDARSLKPRKPVSSRVMNYIDKIFYEGRFTALHETYNLFKTEGIEYSKEELKACRLLTKGLNGLVFTTDVLSKMYPDAVFFALVRNGLAICEGRVRRGSSSVKFAHDYNTIVNKMHAYNEQMSNYHILKYEDMVTAPIDFLKQVYQIADLDVSSVEKIRLESKPIMDETGQHGLTKGHNRQVFWYDLEDVNKHIRSDINENQIKQLKPKDRDKFLSIAGSTMEKLGYI